MHKPYWVPSLTCDTTTGAITMESASAKSTDSGMRRPFPFVWLLVGLVACTLNVWGASILDDFDHRRWSREDGLPDSRIYFIAQSGDGYLWMGTRHGLVRFDGLTFVTYDRSNTGLIINEDFQSGVISADGHLILMAQDQHLLIWRGRGLERGPAMEWTSLTSWFVRPSVFTGDRWLRRNSDHPSVWWSRHPATTVTLPNGMLNSESFEGNDATIHLVQNGSLLRTNPLTGWTQTNSLPPLSGIFTAAFAEDSRGGVWLRYVDASAGAARLYHLEDPGPVIVGETREGNAGRGEFLVATRDGSLWQPIGPKGLERVQNGVSTQYEIAWGRDWDLALCMMQDRDGNLWVGTEESGLHRLRPKSIRSVTAAHGLPHANVRSLAAQSNSVWVGTDGGLAHIEFANPISSISEPQAPAAAALHLVPPPTLLASASNQWPRPVRALANHPSEGVWLGTDRGLLRADDTSLKDEPLPYLPIETDRDSLRTRKLFALLPEVSGGLWIAAAGNLIFRPKEAIGPSDFRTFIMADPGPNALLQDRLGFIWVATQGSGVARFYPQQLLKSAPSSQSLPPSRPRTIWEESCIERFCLTNGLASDHAWNVYEDQVGAIWIATERGLHRLTASTPSAPPEIHPSDRPMHSPASIRNSRQPQSLQVMANDQPGGPREHWTTFLFTTAHGLPENQIECLIEDLHGFVWLGTRHGIARVKAEDLREVAEGHATRFDCRTFTQSDGLPSDDIDSRTSHPSVARTPDGRLWFATSKGLAIIEPRGFIATRHPPLAAIEEFRADDQPVYTTGPVLQTLSTNSAEASHPSTTSIQLAPGRARVIEFQFTGLSFLAPEKCRFRYRLDGYDAPATWHDAGTRRTAFFNNLEPGAYAFQVQAQNHQGIWSETAASLAFSLAPFYWQTWTFKILTTLTSLALVAAIVAWRLRETNRLAHLRQEKAVLTERLELSRDLHDILGAKFTELIQLGNQANNLPPEEAIRNQTRMTQLARDLFQSVRHSVWATTPEADNLPALVDYIEAAAHRLLDPAQITLRLDLPDPIPPIPLSPSARRNVFLAAQEALNNIVKHSGATTATIRIRAVHSEITIDIEDNGKGVQISTDPKKGAILPSAKLGCGLPNVLRRLNEIGGTANLTKREPHGAQLRLKLHS